MVKDIKKYITIEEYWDCNAVKPVTELQTETSSITAHYGLFAPIIADTGSINKEEQWALIYTSNNDNRQMPPNLILKGLGITDLCKQVLLLIAGFNYKT